MVLLLAAGLLAGCIQLPLTPQGSAPSAARPVVVAVMDTGVNPYHAVFDVPSERRAAYAQFVDSLTDATTGASPTHLRITRTGNHAKSVEADRALWAGIEVGKLYWVEGTSLLAITLDPTTAKQTPILDDNSHGAKAAGLVQSTAPGIVVLAIELIPRYCFEDEINPNRPCVMTPDLVAGMAWVAKQPWIDVVSFSFGSFGNHPTPELVAFARETRSAAASGKLLVAANGNEVVPSYVDGVAGPPWMIDVGGASADEHGATPEAATLPDVVANYTTRAPSAVNDSRDDWFGGTSAATPRVAGVLAKALAQIRERSHEPLPKRATATAIRRALNASAAYWNVTEWSPKVPSGDPLSYSTRLGEPTAAPAAQIGWGFVDNATAARIAARVLAHDATYPPEKARAQPFLEATFEARSEYWARAVGQPGI